MIPTAPALKALMSSLSRQSSLGLSWVLVAAVACAQGVTCGTPSVPAPLQPAATAPTVAALVAYVDPEQGDDAAATPGGPAYKTIQAAVTAVATQRGATQMGHVKLLPGWYGYDPSDGRYNGEAWPVVVPPGILIQGLNALNVTLDGGKKVPGPTTYAVASTEQAGLVDVVPCFVFGDTQLNGFDYNLLNRVTIVDADVGVLVTGDGEVHPTVAECLFMNCGVGAQVHSTGSGVQGAHRPKFLWNTFGNCDLGFALTGESSGVITSTRAHPALMNCLFKSTVDLEGVPCHAVSSCAFGQTRFNTSSFVPQPIADPPGTVFDVDLFTHDDLFVGARSAVMQSAYAGTAQDDWWFTDYRLTFSTAFPSATPNPAEGPGVTVFPAITPNGTGVDIGFGPGVTLGPVSAEGQGTYGPLFGPYSGATGHLGYRSGGTFLVGGTVPGERRFGADANGIMFDLIEVHWRPGQNVVLAGVVHPWTPRLWTPGQDHACGVFPGGMAAAPLLGPTFVGDVYLDLWAYQTDPAVTTLLTTTLNGAAASGYAQINLSSFGGPPTFPRFGGVWQAAFIDAATQIVASDAQPFYVGQ